MDDRFLPVDASETALLIHCAHISAHLCMPHVTQRLRNRHRPREHSHHAETERDCNTRLKKEKVVDLSPKLNFTSATLTYPHSSWLRMAAIARSLRPLAVLLLCVVALTSGDVLPVWSNIEDSVLRM